MHLVEFLKDSTWLQNAYVEFEGFESLYVRKGHHIIEGEIVNTFDIANVTALQPGNGAFTKLVEFLFKNYPDIILYVENVLNKRFDEKLERMGFHRLGGERPYCYWKKEK